MNWQSLVTIKFFCKKILRVPATSLSPSSTRYKFLVLPLIILTGILAFSNTYGQDNNQQQQDYLKAITTRSEKIVNVLEIDDSDKYHTVLNELVDQYSRINTIHEQSKEVIDQIERQSLSKEATEEAVKQQEAKKKEQLEQRHAKFIAQLKNNLSEDQLEKVKDGMTYRVFPITYAGYLDMLPSLTTEQKNQIYAWLKEARELAMDAESAEKKHAVFGKYKGRINNYLSQAGYDLKKESKAWQERIKERQKNK